jgi:hypothetical protein
MAEWKTMIVDAARMYRVVGVSADGARVAVAEGMTSGRAYNVKMLLVNANAFPEVEIESIPEER